MRRHWRTLVGFFVLGSTVVALTAGCNGKSEPKMGGPKIQQVGVVPARFKEVIDFEDFTGMLEAVKKVEIQARVTGYLEQTHFREGAPVKKKELLFELDARPYQAKLDEAEAAVIQARAKQRRLDGDLLRAQELFRSRSISKEEFDKVVGERDEAKAAVGVSEAARAGAQLMVAYTKITSPIDGKVGKALLDEGNLVKADDSILAVVVSQDPIFAYFDVDERTLLRLNKLVGEGKISSAEKTRVEVRMALADDQGFPHKGYVDFEDNRVDPNTGTKRYRGVFDNKEGRFEPGMFARIRFQVGLPRQALVVPEQGVGADQGQKYVYVVNDKNEVEYRKIKTGALDRGLRVVDEGLKEGERIVVTGLQRIRPMAKVEPREETLPNVPAVEGPKINLPKQNPMP